MKIYPAVTKTLFVLILLFCMTAYSQETLKIRVTEWPPVYYQDKSGQWTGLDVELIRIILKRAGLKATFDNRPWIRGLKELEYGKIHIMLNMSKTKERSAYTYWIGPIRKDKNMCVVLKKGIKKLPINSIDDLVTMSKKYSKQFGLQRGGFYSKKFNERLNKDPEFSEHFADVGDIYTNVKLTLYGRILGFVESPFNMAYLIKNDQRFKNLSIHPFRFKKGDEIEDIYFGVSKAGVNKHTLKKIQDAYEIYKKDDTLKKIVRKWNNKF